ncbi:V-type ATP synthase subunit D [Fusibacter bizertensis]|jgi:H(+)-transporting ATP synthase, vacuolar type, subunit D|uniref:V-type ATP synthase subunit D n=1 Tax=Fusibacter bizertensis TaxID=1488331 RepID=A0ABT6NFY9_9FIRM|nr:V-type ATP synthase subunit D [Fusibacter bizertensis]MDH8679316.1 V-type ATP synthase subunit D [Fusibacter bizertensis]
MEKLTPTKANLMKSKSLLAFSKQGYQLLDKKRSVLVREMMTMIEEVKELQIKIDEIFVDVYAALNIANITMGASAVTEAALSIPKDENIKILNKSIMNVEIPTIKAEEQPLKPYYGFYRTSSAIDITVVKMREVHELMYKLAEVENAVFRLAIEIRQTSKRANALDKIQIPKYVEMTKWIEESLEEKEREDFFRLKRLKGKKF